MSKSYLTKRGKEMGVVNPANVSKPTTKKVKGSTVYTSAKGGVLDVGKLVILLLVFSMLFTALTNAPLKSFSSLLEYLQTAPSVSASIVNWKPLVLGDWGVFDWLRTFVNSFSGFFSRLALIGTSVLDTIFLVLWFFAWLVL